MGHPARIGSYNFLTMSPIHSENLRLIAGSQNIFRYLNFEFVFLENKQFSNSNSYMWMYHYSLLDDKYVFYYSLN